MTLTIATKPGLPRRKMPALARESGTFRAARAGTFVCTKR